MHVLEEDDGSGWVKVADDSGGKGLVPASYVELLGHGPGAAQTQTKARSTSTPVPRRSQANADYGTCWGTSSIALCLAAPFGLTFS